ncbi:phage holin family protein, partial [Klebsiella pneumoniae]
MVTLILVWILNAVALLAVAYLLPGIAVASFGSALIAALVLGLVNMLVKPVLVLLTLPITIVTLGLFLIVINALLFWFVG